MMVLYILKHDADDTLSGILCEHKRSHDVTVVDIRKEQDYDRIVDLIESGDTVISW